MPAMAAEIDGQRKVAADRGQPFAEIGRGIGQQEIRIARGGGKALQRAGASPGEQAPVEDLGSLAV